MDEFEQLVDAHYEALYRFALSLAKDVDAASDLVQQTFCIWAEKGEQLRDRTKAKTWLFTTLHREFLSQVRHSNRYSSDGLDAETVASIPAEEDNAERQLDGRRVMELLGSLEECYRSPLTLFYLQQHSYKEIARILDLPIGTIMSRISRGKELLRKQMTSEPSSAPKNILQLNPEALRKSHG
jgi:RNA polymerase sigma factor (sigma-70 family)